MSLRYTFCNILLDGYSGLEPGEVQTGMPISAAASISMLLYLVAGVTMSFSFFALRIA